MGCPAVPIRPKSSEPSALHPSHPHDRRAPASWQGEVPAISCGVLPPRLFGRAPQDNRLNCPGRRSEPVRPWSCVAATVEVGRPQGFQHGGKQGGRRGPPSRMKIALRAKRFEPLLRGPRRPPCFLGVKILPGLRTAHGFPRCRKQRRNSSNCSESPALTG
jgi:hypothetical protein